MSKNSRLRKKQLSTFRSGLNTTAIRFKSIGLWRITLAAAVCVMAAMIVATMTTSASNPSNETLTDMSGSLTFTAGPFNFSNATPVIELDSGPRCSGAMNTPNTFPFPCDSNALTVNIPADYLTLHPNASVKVTMFWTDTGSGQSDYDLYIFKGTVGSTSGSQPAAFQSAGSTNPEIAFIPPPLV